MAVNSIKTKLYKKAVRDTDWVQLLGVQEIPELGGEKEAIEITTLNDEAHLYMNGLISYGDTLSFTMLYDSDEFASLNSLGDEVAQWKVELNDGSTFTFGGNASVKLSAIGTGASITYSLNIHPTSKIEFVKGE